MLTKAPSVGLSAECVPAFEDLKLGKKTKFVIYKLSDDKKSVEVEKKGDDADYDAFLAHFPEDDCRYAIYDFEYTLPGGEGKRYVFSPAWNTC